MKRGRAVEEDPCGERADAGGICLRHGQRHLRGQDGRAHAGRPRGPRRRAADAGRALGRGASRVAGRAGGWRCTAGAGPRGRGMAGEGLRAHRRDQDHADQPQRDPQRGLSRPLGPGRDLRPPALRTGRLCCGGGAADLRGRARRPAQFQAGAGSGGAGAALHGLRAALRAAAGGPGALEGGLRADAPEPALSICGVPRGPAGDGGLRGACAVRGRARADRGPHRHRQDGGGALRRAEGAGRGEGDQRVLSHRAHHGPQGGGERAEFDAL